LTCCLCSWLTFSASEKRSVISSASFFDVLDLNGDGYLSKDEIARVFTEAGFEDNSFVYAAFKHMDVNKDGKLSYDAYASGEYEYLTTEDEHLLFGPLVD
jgi:Ca2+-binding EF-hand superfamily protein